jgi:hypothetical protein
MVLLQWFDLEFARERIDRLRAEADAFRLARMHGAESGVAWLRRGAARALAGFGSGLLAASRTIAGDASAGSSGATQGWR